MSNYWKSIFKIRKKLFRSNYFLILCILFLIFCLFLNYRVSSINQTSVKSTNENDIHLFIDRIRDIAILDQNTVFNITFNLTGNDIPKWLNHYEISHLFNFYWLQNGAYLWHLQRMMDFKQIASDTKRISYQIFLETFDQTNVFDYLHHHPEYGIVIDTASDPIQPLFSPLPQSDLPLEKTCEQFEWLKNLYPCTTRSEMISSFSFKPLITYALYDVTIQYKHSSTLNTIHYDEIIFLFDNQQETTNETYFIKQLLPRLIRLLALVPTTALILFPYSNTTKVYINQYIDILIERKLINDKNRFIPYNSNQIYHTNVVYSTSSPRSDIILLNKILIGDKPPARRELILIVRKNFDDTSYHEIIDTIEQFELPEAFEYLHVHEYTEELYDLNQISHLFRQARIVIGMPTDILSHIVWCLPHTHIIEIIQKTMTTDYYEISLQLRLNYWLTIATKTNKIDIIDFRNLMMKVFTDIDA